MSDDAILQRLLESGIKRANRDEPMARHTSWRLGGCADYFCIAETVDHLLAAVRIARSHKLPWLVLGGGNNVLVSDDGIEGIVILNRLRGLKIQQNETLNGDAPTAQLICGAGVFFAKAAQYSARHGFSGMEWGIAIPGTVGGGVVNNAGAHWSDVSRSLQSADLVDERGHVESMSATDLRYKYRQSALKTKHLSQTRLIVTSCRFVVSPDDPIRALARVEELRLHRLRTQPVKEASAGSTFENPPEGHAGALIDEAGFKGKRIGGAQIAPLHANFILNVGGARAADVFELIREAQASVEQKFGVRLHPEIQFVGRWNATQLDDVLSNDG